MLGVIIIGAFIFIAVFAEWLAPYNPLQQGVGPPLEPPSWAHLFGTDSIGRDILSRVIFGARLSLLVGTVVILAALCIGLVYGSLAGYLGGWVDEIMMRITDMFLSLPSLVLAMAIAAALGASLEKAMIAMIVAWWAPYARLVRGNVLSVKENLYVEAARAVGESTRQIIIRHIVPNVISSMIVIATFDIGFAITTMAGLSFIGLGAQPPTPELGAMVATGRSFVLSHWWISTFPGLAIFLIVWGFNFLGDGLKDALDPRIRHY
jgi:peptide/nickel transport system permease protein